MRHLKCMASWGLVFFCTFILVSQVIAFPGPDPNVFRGYCTSDRGKSVIYFSDVLTAATTVQGNKASASLSGPVRGAFEEFLRQKYSFNGNGTSSCGFGNSSVVSIKADMDRLRTLFKSQNKKIIDTGWKYTAK